MAEMLVRLRVKAALLVKRMAEVLVKARVMVEVEEVPWFWEAKGVYPTTEGELDSVAGEVFEGLEVSVEVLV